MQGEWISREVVNRTFPDAIRSLPDPDLWFFEMRSGRLLATNRDSAADIEWYPEIGDWSLPGKV